LIKRYGQTNAAVLCLVEVTDNPKHHAAWCLAEMDGDTSIGYDENEPEKEEVDYFAKVI